MSDAFHRAKLSEGALAWNLWRDSNPLVVPDLEDAVIASPAGALAETGPLDFRRARLKGADLRGLCLTAADFEGAGLAGATLAHARLDGANLSRADLTGAALDDADVSGARFDGAVVDGARLALARNLTQSQADRCLGDGETTLPAGIERPTSWLRRAGAGGAAASGFAPGDPERESAVQREIFATLQRAKKSIEDGRPDRAARSKSARKDPHATRPVKRRLMFAAGAALAALAALVFWRQATLQVIAVAQDKLTAFAEHVTAGR